MKRLILAFILAINSYAFESEFVIPAGQFGKTHGSSVLTFPNGEILSCFFGATEEGHVDAQIYCSRKVNGKWQTPNVVVARQEKPDGSQIKNQTVGNSVLHLDRFGRTWMFYVSVQLGGWSTAQVNYKVSIDMGKTWSKGKLISKGIGKLARTGIIELPDGSFILPLYHEVIKKNGMLCHLKATAFTITYRNCKRIPGNEHIQPAIAYNKEKTKLHIYMRNMKRGNVFYSSLDLRKLPKLSYSAVEELDLPNPDASVDVETDRDGNILLVYNHSHTHRTPLTLARSADGKNFETIKQLETADKRFSYPYFIKDRKGVFHLTYTYDGGHGGIKYVRFTEQDLK